MKINLLSDLINKAALAKRVGLSKQNFHDKLIGRGKSRPFTTDELTRIESIFKEGIYENSKKPLAARNGAQGTSDRTGTNDSQ